MESRHCGQDKRIPSTAGTESTNASGLIGLFRKKPNIAQMDRVNT